MSLYNTTFTIRCNSEKLARFKDWCNKANKEYQDILREAMEAAPEGRLSIIPNKEQKKILKELYE